MLEMNVRNEYIKELLRMWFKLFNNEDENTKQTTKMFQRMCLTKNTFAQNKES